MDLRNISRGWWKLTDKKIISRAAHLFSEPGIIAKYSEGKISGYLLHRTHLPLFKSYFEKDFNYSEPRKPQVESRFSLRPYQAEAVSWLHEKNGGLLCDDLGLGKSRICLAFADYPAIVVCPNTGITVWANEAAKGKLRVKILSGKITTEPTFDDADLYICPYSVAENWLPWLNRYNDAAPKIRTRIVDEAHVLHNPKLLALTGVNALQADKTVVVTATPVRNYLSSIWSLLNLAAPKAFGTYFEFRTRYCAAVQGIYGIEDGEPSAADIEALSLRLSQILLRRTREEVDLPLPKIERESVTVHIGDYFRRGIEKEMRKVAAAAKAQNYRLVQSTLLKKRLDTFRIDTAIKVYEEHSARFPRAVFWVWFRESAHLLKSRLSDRFKIPVDVLNGETKQKARRDILRRWHHDTGDPYERRLLVASIAASSDSVSYTTAGLAIFVGYPWTSVLFRQAETRTHRWGQVHDPCKVVYLTIPQSYDDVMFDILKKKAYHSDYAVNAQDQLVQIAKMLKDPDETTDKAFMEALATNLKEKEDE